MKEKPYNYGGQAVIEGVMMRGKDIYALAVRTPQDNIEVEKTPISSASKRIKLFKLPIIRGIFAFVDSLVLGLKIIARSAELAGLEPEGDKEKGGSLSNLMIYSSVAVAIAISIGLFILLPTVLANFSGALLKENTWALGIVEGLLRIAIFVGYILLIASLKDVKRVFQYHGAEHKTINCYESKSELTVENVHKHSRLHKRCGTSFLIFVMLISMVVFMFIKTDIIWLRFALRILLVPFIAGISYEVIKWAGNSDSAFVNAVSYPGICLQRLTTAEPDSQQIEVAIAALNEVLEHENSTTAENSTEQPGGE